MKITKEVKVQGNRVYIDDNSLKVHFIVNETVFEKQYHGPMKGRSVWVNKEFKLYKARGAKGFYVGLGAIQWLNKHSKLIEFKITDINPLREEMGPLIIPENLLNSPKFKVNGKERYYFYESLEACFNNLNGNIRLPTGSGKTVIELVLAYNCSKYLGTTLIIVPTLTIKSQFIESAEVFGIPIVDYRDYTINHPKGTIVVGTHHIIADRLTGKNKVEKQHTKNILEKIDAIMLDEAQHACCKSWFDILINLNQCQRVYGFSAMPVAYDIDNAEDFDSLDMKDAKVVGIIGDVLYQKSAKDLKDFLNLPYLVNLKYQWREKAHKHQNAKDWQKIRKAIIGNKDRTKFIADLMQYLVDQGYKVATFVNQKSHAHDMLEHTTNGIACWFGGEIAFDKKGDIDIRDIRDHFGKDIKGLIFTSHAIEGLDFSNPINVVLLHEGKSIRQTVQKVGRIVRPDVKASIVINMCDRGCNILPKQSNVRAGDIINEFHCKPRNCTTIPDLIEILEIIEEERT